MKLKKLILPMVIIALVLAGCTAKAPADKELVVGMELAYPPFETKDQQGNPSGLSVDLANALGEYLGRPVRIENTNWDGLIPSLQTGKIDIVLSSMTITDERSKIVDFSDPYARAYLAFLVNGQSPVKTYADLNSPDRVIAVKKGTSGAIWVEKNLPNAKVNNFSSENACVTEVIQGKADAFIYDQLTIYRQNQENLDTTKTVSIDQQTGDGWGMAVKKGNTELLNSINSFLKEYKTKGGFDGLTNKYLSSEKKIFDQLGFPWFF